MTEQIVKLPDDSANTGRQMRTIENTIAGKVVEQEPVMLTDQTGADLSANIANLNITLTALRDAIVGVGPKTLTDVATALGLVTKPTDDQLVHATNLDVLLSTRLKPADTLTGVTTVGAVTGITNPLPAGTNTLGKVDQGVGGASAWKVDGTGGAFPVSGSVGVSNFPASQPTTNVNQDGAFAALGATTPTLSVLMGGTDGTVQRALRLDQNGRLTPGLDDAMLRELTMIRQGIGVLLSQFSTSVDLTQLNELEAM